MDPSSFHGFALSICALTTLISSGLTTRWTISLPMIPFVVVQLLRYLSSSTSKLHLFLQIVSFLLIVKSFFLTILFPAVKINEVRGKYNVGVVDLYLPVENFEHDHVTIRLLYPTLEKESKIPYFDVETRDKICNLLMEHGAPPPLNKLLFLLNQWKLSTINGAQNAKPYFPKIETKREESKSDISEEDNGIFEPSKLPIVVYSHGLTGSAEIYSYQTMSLAANGYLVMSITHSDRSAIGVKRKDGSFIEYDNNIIKLSMKKDTYTESVQERRKQTDYRANELLAAITALMKLNKENIPELEKLGVSFVGQMNLADMSAMGHSFGGATVIHACNKKPEYFSRCIAHDPAVDWCPDVTRKVLFSKDRFEGSEISYDGGTGGLPNYEENDFSSPNIQDLDLYFLYSHEWYSKNWGHSNFLRDLFRRGKLGRKHGETEVTFVYKANHSEFSDSCMKLPTWIARPVGVTGSRNPHETSEEIFDRTFTFLEKSRDKKDSKSKLE